MIELTPEWVLDKLTHSKYADGEGNVSVYSDSVTDIHWIELALTTLEIKYEYNEYGDFDQMTMGFDFRLEDILKGCPNLYTSLSELDRNNKKHKDQRNLWV